MSRKKAQYTGSATEGEDLRTIYAFAYTEDIAREIADGANRLGLSRRGMFVPGSFTVKVLPYRLPCVCGQLTGKGLLDPQENAS